MITRRFLLGTALLASPAIARARTEINLIVPSSPGGSADTTARLLGQQLDIVGVPNKVINRSAGAGVEGALYVLRSSADSGNVLIGGPRNLMFIPARERLSYDINNFEPLCMFSRAAFALVVRSDKYVSVNELLDEGRRRPVSIGSGAEENEFLLNNLFRLGQSNMTYIPYRGGGDVARDILSGVLDAGHVSIATVAGAVASGLMKLMAHTLDNVSENITSYPELNHLSKVTGIYHESLSSYHWHGLYTPRGILMPELVEAVRKICDDTKFINEHLSRGMVVNFMVNDEFRQYHEMVDSVLIRPALTQIRR